MLVIEYKKTEELFKKTIEGRNLHNDNKKSLLTQALVVLPTAIPILISINISTFLILLITWFNPTIFNLYSTSFSNILLFIILIVVSELLILIFGWLYDIYIESSLAGYYTAKVRKNIRYGFYLFLISETMLFFSFFWAYFHSAIAPTEFISCWPPLGIQKVEVIGLPFLGTIILILSGVTITVTNKVINLDGSTRFDFGRSLFITIFLGCIFLAVQIYEYTTLKFSFHDSVLGSSFYMLTGFHGFHVFLGLILLITSYWIFYNRAFTQNLNLFLEMSILYWHFVDLIWLILFILIYWLPWGDQLNAFISCSLFYIKPIYSKSSRYKYFFHNILNYIVIIEDINLQNLNLKRVEGQLNLWHYFFNTPYSDTSREIIYFHGYIFSLILVLAIFVFWILFENIWKFKAYTYSKNPISSFTTNSDNLDYLSNKLWSWIFFSNNEDPLKLYGRRYSVNYSVYQPIEFWWTVIPGMIILSLSISSLLLLYSWDTGLGISLEGRKANFLQNLLIKVRGSQWFWTYEIFFNNENTGFESLFRDNVPKKDFSGYSYIINRLWNFEAHINTNSLFNTKNLETVDNLIIPIQKLIKFIITSSDVIHSWAVPSFGIKVDAIPGRANVQSIILHLKGVVYGQCSEICGIKHAFMPISIEIENAANWLQYTFTNNNTQPYWLISKIYKDQYEVLTTPYGISDFSTFDYIDFQRDTEFENLYQEELKNLLAEQEHSSPLLTIDIPKNFNSENIKIKRIDELKDYTKIIKDEIVLSGFEEILEKKDYFGGGLYYYIIFSSADTWASVYLKSFEYLTLIDTLIERYPEEFEPTLNRSELRSRWKKILDKYSQEVDKLPIIIVQVNDYYQLYALVKSFLIKKGVDLVDYSLEGITQYWHKFKIDNGIIVPMPIINDDINSIPLESVEEDTIKPVTETEDDTIEGSKIPEIISIKDDNIIIEGDTIISETDNVTIEGSKIPEIISIKDDNIHKDIQDRMDNIQDSVEFVEIVSESIIEDDTIEGSKIPEIISIKDDNIIIEDDTIEGSKIPEIISIKDIQDMMDIIEDSFIEDNTIAGSKICEIVSIKDGSIHKDIQDMMDIIEDSFIKDNTIEGSKIPEIISIKDDNIHKDIQDMMDIIEDSFVEAVPGPIIEDDTIIDEAGVYSIGFNEIFDRKYFGKQVPTLVGLEFYVENDLELFLLEEGIKEYHTKFTTITKYEATQFWKEFLDTNYKKD